MGFLDGIIDGHFKTTSDGTMLFYPRESFGKGYKIPNTEKKQEIQRYLRRNVIVSSLVIFIFGLGLFEAVKYLSVPWWIALLIFLAIVTTLSLVDRHFLNQLTRNLIQVDQKLTLAESYQSSAKSHDLFVLVLLEIGSLLSILVGAFMLLDASMVWYLRLGGAMSIVFFGYASLGIGYMIKVKDKH